MSNFLDSNKEIIKTWLAGHCSCTLVIPKDFAKEYGLSVAAILIRNRPKGMKGFVYDYITSRLDRLKDGEHLEPILTSDVWYDLTDENRNSKWSGVLAKFFKQKYGFSIKSQKAAKRRTRETIISYIKDVCDELKIRRFDVNIYAGDIGYLYFRGARHAISLDELGNLRHF